MIEKYPYKKEGEAFKKLMNDKGYSIYKFALLTKYSLSRMYRLCNGECDLANVQVYNAIMFARVLGFKYVDDLYEALGIDILKDLR